MRRPANAPLSPERPSTARRPAVRTTRIPLSLASLGVAALVLSGCAQGDGAASPSASVNGTTSARAKGTEVQGLAPRAVLSYDGGLLTVDTKTGEVVEDVKQDGFLRLNNAGDGRHVMVSDGDRFRVFDTGLEAVPHGDHHHYYESDPALTQRTFDAPHAGHVVLHDGKTTLFGDGDGSIQTFASDALKKEGEPEVARKKTEAPHHGVALELSDGTLLTTQGTEDERHTVQVLHGDGSVKAETTDCPGVHGEAAAAPGRHTDTVVVGCENGPVVYRDGAFHKIPVKDAYARSGNLAGSETSPVVLGDYKVDKDAEQERPTRVALFDTAHGTHKLVELGSSYWFRSLARGPRGEGLVLTYDGKLNVVDQDTGAVTRRIDVIEPWREKADWQQPGPAVKVAGGNAYVTDAENRKLHVVDLAKGQVVRSIDLPQTPVELAVTTGRSETRERGAGATSSASPHGGGH
ncbi:hypothetical protein [Kocuria sp.]|uniref:hypothetical protein n=1 Tax=Kocuria sp. TaxID=1871328 RepID=UPI0026DC7098|nr:hypothetical protein [Kocuria sp.]MDO4917956.1 hypothetical protein [Kocuria sp.]